MNKYKNKPKGLYRSKLEETAAELLTKAGIDFEYEPWQITLQKAYTTGLVCYEKVGKQFKQSKSVRSIKYTPDFVGSNWIIETKGRKTEAFMIRWKLFKKILEDQGKNYALFLPSSKKEIIESLEIIKNLKDEKK